MIPRPSGLLASLVMAACAIGILIVAVPVAGTPQLNGYTPTATPAAAIYLPWIASDFVGLPTATPTVTPTATPTLTPSPTPTLPPACPLPALIDPAIAINVTPNRSTAMEQMIGKAPFTVTLSASATGGVFPYSYCWDIEPDSHQDATGASAAFTLTRAGIFNPLVIVIDAEGHGQYIGVLPGGTTPTVGGKP